ncbi:MAG: 3'-5' exoribonuclease [bacterium]|nr:3'-5' exoribonuclease [bacterium]
MTEKITLLLGIDFETANEKAHPCSMGIAMKKLWGEWIIPSAEMLINPESYFSWRCVQVHGITEDMTANSPIFPEAIEKFRKLSESGALVLAHNAPFDIKQVMSKSCERYSISMPKFKFIDTLTASRIMTPKPHTLSDMASKLKIESFSHHKAGADARACVMIFEALMKQAGANAPEEFASKIGIEIGSAGKNIYKPCMKKQDA